MARQLRVPSSASTTHEAAYKALRCFVISLAKYLDRVAKILDTMTTTDDQPQHLQQQDNNVWDGREALAILKDEIGLTKDTLAVYQQHYESIRLEEDEQQRIARREGKQEATSKLDITYDLSDDMIGSEEDEVDLDDKDDEESGAGDTRNRRHTKTALSSQSKIVISKMLTVFSFMYMNDCEHVDKYRMVIERVSDNQRKGQRGAKKDISFNLWCLSADVAFKDLGVNCHSIILTSGTLSPLESFAGELGVSFPVRVEASHVIDAASQVSCRYVVCMFRRGYLQCCPILCVEWATTYSSLDRSNKIVIQTGIANYLLTGVCECSGFLQQYNSELNFPESRKCRFSGLCWGGSVVFGPHHSWWYVGVLAIVWSIGKTPYEMEKHKFPGGV